MNVLWNRSHIIKPTVGFHLQTESYNHFIQKNNHYVKVLMWTCRLNGHTTEENRNLFILTVINSTLQKNAEGVSFNWWHLWKRFKSKLFLFGYPLCLCVRRRVKFGSLRHQYDNIGMLKLERSGPQLTVGVWASRSL